MSACSLARAPLLSMGPPDSWWLTRITGGSGVAAGLGSGGVIAACVAASAVLGALSTTWAGVEVAWSSTTGLGVGALGGVGAR